ncbi:MAG: AgmX/PglI C-terminal domain-containing protein [Deltaproteobacteria bacterium]|nr:AgmX/PglI C-terminal domain-containing protein [Deltaproteobacteria bacterium]
MAVDESRITAGGEGKRIVVPVEVPAAARNISYSAGGGFGVGGGGYGYGSIASGGSYSSIASRTASGWGFAARAPTYAIPEVRIGMPVVRGSLDAAIIKRYVKRHLAKIQYCYEKVLLAKPTLAGVIQTQFLINGNGMVVTATATGMDKQVADCVAGVIKAIEFPHPTNGDESIQINYPFTFSPAWKPPVVPSRLDAIKELLK